MASAVIPLSQLLYKVNAHKKGFLLGNREEEIWKRVMSLFIIYIYIVYFFQKEINSELPFRKMFVLDTEKNIPPWILKYHYHYFILMKIHKKWGKIKHWSLPNGSIWRTCLLCVHVFKQIFLHSHVPWQLLLWGLGNQWWINRQKFLPFWSFHFSCRSPTLNYTSLVLNRGVTWQCLETFLVV